MASLAPSSGAVQVLRCSVLFNGTKYRNWVPRLCLHMRDLCLWEFLTGDIPCPAPPVPPVKPTIPDTAAEAVQKKLLDGIICVSVCCIQDMVR